MSNNEVTDYTGLDEGEIPGLDENKPLGAPTSRVRDKTNVSKLLMLGGVLLGFVFILGGLLIWQKNKAPSEKTAQQVAELNKPAFKETNQVIDSESIARTKAELKAREEQERLAREKEEADAKALLAQQAAQQNQQQAAQRTQTQQPAAHGAAQDPNKVVLTPNERKMTGSVLLGSSGAPIDPNSQPSEKELQDREVQARLERAGIAPKGAQQPQGGFFNSGQPNAQGAGADSLAGRLNGTSLQARKAGRLPNLDYLLKKGTSIPCTLKTGIDTTLPGFVICIAQNDIYSANGKMLLVERGATIFGEQQSALKQGQARTFILWTRIDNPSGVYADIDSPATDQMGYSGISGYVETYFWQRFGGAIMLSLIKDFSQAYSSKAAGTSNNNSSNYGSTQQATQDMASEALRNSINIPPTLLVLPGKSVNVLVARDVSFESVYELSH